MHLQVSAQGSKISVAMQFCSATTSEEIYEGIKLSKEQLKQWEKQWHQALKKKKFSHYIIT